MPNTDQTFCLNWRAFSSGDRRTDGGSDLSIFVGDLDSEVTDALLHETFASKYPSVKGAKVVVDSNNDRSKCYGFVRFGDENERSRAMMEMNGVYCTSRPMRISIATHKKQATQEQYSSQGAIYYLFCASSYDKKLVFSDNFSPKFSDTVSKDSNLSTTKIILLTRIILEFLESPMTNKFFLILMVLVKQTSLLDSISTSMLFI